MYQHPKARKGTSHVNVKSTNTTRVELKKKSEVFISMALTFLSQEPEECVSFLQGYGDRTIGNKLIV